MNIIVVGGGETLYFLCRSFAEQGHKVTVVNRDREECVLIARRLSTVTVVRGDGSDTSVLEDAGIMSAHAILAITPNDQDNLVISQLATLKYNVPRSVALANDPDNEAVFRRLGVSSFSTTRLIGNLIGERVSFQNIMNLIPVAGGRVNVTEIALDSSSPVVGRALREINLPESALIAVIVRDEQAIVPRGGNTLMAGDHVVLISVPECHTQAVRMFSKTGRGG